MIINSQLGGKKPTGTKSITANGTHNVADYEYADVQVPTTAPAHYIEFNNNSGTLSKKPVVLDFTGVTTIEANALLNAYTYVSFPSNSSLVLSNFKTVKSAGLASMFANTQNIISIILSDLETIEGSALSSFVNFSSNLQTLVFSKLKKINGSSNFTNCCGGCQKLSSVSFNGLTSSSFGNASAFNYMFNVQTGSQATGGCTVHFPSNLDPQSGSTVISSLTGYPTFGGSDSYIHLAYDLPATE